MPAPTLFADPHPGDRTANLLAAARALAAALTRSRPLDRRLVAEVMTTAFGGTDAAGAWIWRDAYDAMEAALLLQIRRLAPQVGRLEDGPAEICALLAGLSDLSLTHTRRSDEQIALDQFSTPPELAAVATLAAQVRPGDQVLEPSAGTGLLAVVAEACGGALTLNERAAGRATLLDALFPDAPRSRHDALYLADVLPTSGGFHVVLANPPFTHLEAHLLAGLLCLADGGRLAAIVPIRLFDDREALTQLAQYGAIRGRLVFPPRAFAKHGTSVDTGLIVIDRGHDVGVIAPVHVSESLADAASWARDLKPRATAQARPFRTVAPAAVLAPAARALARPSTKLAFLADAEPVAFETKPWTGEGHDVGLYQAYTVSRLALAQSNPHPSALVESSAMGSVAPPAPTYRPILPRAIVRDALISDAQMEAVIYAGEAHSTFLPGWWTPGDAAHRLVLVPEATDGAFQLRRGFFVGDGTGCGKGREAAAVIADNMAQGRQVAVWLSLNDKLREDATRDWTAIGGAASDIVPQGAWKQADSMRIDKGIIYTTYATLRQPARGDRPSRLDQLVACLGADFEGVIVFDEGHSMANAAGGGDGVRGPSKPSQQGMAGVALQNRLPKARILYLSATGAASPEDLAYATRLGLWGGPDAPFPTREAFLESITQGGVAVMELIARELKAMGLYIARALSFEGVEYDVLHHTLTAEDIAIWNAWADAYQLIHQNLRAALEAVGVLKDDKIVGRQAMSVALSAFEGAKLRFFGSLLAGIKAPTLIAAMRRDLADGRAPVVQLVSTNEAIMERALAKIPPEEWSNLSIDLSGKDYALDYLTGAFPIHAMEAVEDDEGKVIDMRPLIVDGRPVVSQEALRRREALIADLACLPAVPGVLDAVLAAFGPDQIAEVTGRARRVIPRGGRRVVERRGASAAKAEVHAFMSGAKRALVYSQAGSTGISCHADLACGNQARRSGYIPECGFQAKVAVQGMGRIHRTNQAVPPQYHLMVTDIDGEKRFTSTIARRLDSLGALTKGERRTASGGLFRAEDNLESPWAHRALQAFYVALHLGDVPAMDLETFERKTGLSLLDADGGLKASDDLPPMNTWLNRMLALRIADQNALFVTFNQLLDGILERAAASGALDKGLEDIVADALDVLSEEVIRTDAVTGAETRLIRFAIRSRRRFLTAQDALDQHAHLEPEALDLVVNSRSGGAALATKGLTTIDDEDRLIPAVRLTWAERSRVIALKDYEESAWEPVPPSAWRAAWDKEIADADPWRSRELILVTGLLLPVWKHLPSQRAFVRRLKAPDGRRWLGRVLEPIDAAKLKVALGLSDAAAALGGAGDIARVVLKDGVSVALAGGYWLRRARVMDRWRIEIVNAGRDRESFTLLGCFVEIIAYQPRVFVPVDKPAVLAAVLARHPASAVEGLAA